MATTVILVRHGQSEGNRSHRFQGQIDTPLTALGRVQAAAAARRLARVPVDVLYSSDLLRARQTAEAIGQTTGLTPILDARWRELDLGHWEGLSRAEVAERFPDEWQGWSNKVDLRRGGGESYQDLRQRGLAALQQVVARHPGQTVCVAAHEALIRMIISHYRGVGVFDQWWQLPPSPNACITFLRCDGDNVDIVSLFERAHLPVSLYLARHGETDWNLSGRVQGGTDVPLNALGQRQAHALARRMRAEQDSAQTPVTAIYTSNLTRARATAEAMGAALQLPVIADARLQEMHWGRWEGLTADELHQREPRYEAWRQAKLDFRRGETGETYAELRARVAAMLEEVIVPKHRGEAVAVVAHGGTLGALLDALPGLGAWRATVKGLRFDNASLTIAHRDDVQSLLEQFADSSHLNGLGQHDEELSVP